jgi:hypothetical protein
VLSFKVEKTEDGFGYTILQHDTPWIVQPYDPEKPGFVPMSEERATELAEAFISQKEAEQAALLEAQAQADAVVKEPAVVQE